MLMCLAGGLIAFGLTAKAQTEVRCPTPGTTLKTSTGDTVEFIGDAHSSICRVRNIQTGKVHERVLGGALSPTFRVIQPNLATVQSLSPLQVGKSVNFDYKGPAVTGEFGSWTYVLSVEKYEPVATSAGVFPCYVILYSEETQRYTGKWERRYWYSPDIGYIIKYEFRTIRGDDPPDPPKNWVLVELKRPPEDRSANK
jgi:hypothetical protein